MANIKDVAKEAGVSVTTVSRVMNNRGYISEKTRKKVYDAIDKINYHPNELAKNLQQQKTNLNRINIAGYKCKFLCRRGQIY